jgi:hypothetical protein
MNIENTEARGLAKRVLRTYGLEQPFYTRHPLEDSFYILVAGSYAYLRVYPALS